MESALVHSGQVWLMQLLPLPVVASTAQEMPIQSAIPIGVSTASKHNWNECLKVCRSCLLTAHSKVSIAHPMHQPSTPNKLNGQLAQQSIRHIHHTIRVTHHCVKPAPACVFDRIPPPVRRIPYNLNASPTNLNPETLKPSQPRHGKIQKSK